MKIAILGAGFTGLTAAYRLLEKGHDVTILEKDAKPGGLAIGYKEKDWNWTLEAFYHHWFTNDDAILSLAKELNFPVITRRPKTSSFIDNHIYQLDSPLTLLTFPKLSLVERLRMASVLALLRYDPFWQPLEKVQAHTVLEKSMGEHAYKMIWEPLLINKFGSYAPQISLAWFWARIKKRTSSLAYPEGGFLRFAEKLADAVTERHGKILYNTAAEKISETEKGISLGKNFPIFDKVIVTLPSFAFLKIAPLSENYKKHLSALKGIGAVVLVVRLKEKFFKDNTYWLNVCEKNAPVLAIVEHTNFMNASHYNNEHLLYLGNYLSQDHRYFSMSEEELMQEFDPYLKKINPNYKKNIIAVKKFSVPFAQPIVPTNYSKMIPSFTTPMTNVYLANMQQVYPWDRGTNYAVDLGNKVAALLQ